MGEGGEYPPSHALTIYLAWVTLLRRRAANHANGEHSRPHEMFPRWADEAARELWMQATARHHSDGGTCFPVGLIRPTGKHSPLPKPTRPTGKHFRALRMFPRWTDLENVPRKHDQAMARGEVFLRVARGPQANQANGETF